MDWIVPMSPILTKTVIESEDFIHEVKWDGIRGLCYIEGGAIRIFTKQGRERTPFYPELNVLPSLLKGSQAILDGEIVILDNNSRPTFQLSLIRERINTISKVSYYQKKLTAQYIVFDILALNGRLLTNNPFHERRMLLLENLKEGSSTAITDDFPNGKDLLMLMRERGWEGIVSKRKDSLYHSYKNHRDWFKTKLTRKILAIVMGVTLKEGLPNSLILAINSTEGFSYIGKASIGLTFEHLKQLKDVMPLLNSADSYVIPGMSITEQKKCVRFIPQLTVWVSFLEWTSDGCLRHPKILGFSDLTPEEADGREFIE